MRSPALESYIEAHAEWRERFQSAIDGIDGDQLHALVAMDSHECVLGEALQDMGHTSDAQYVALTRIRLAHEQFHLIAARIVNLLHDGMLDEAQTLLDTEFIQVSDSLIAKLGTYSKIA